ncbi:nucleotide-diphospho-sugar transferase [Hortaea werneckii]|nr:nucleotide-diphospho-sugar transferase [Hortaea werneckii]KAI7109685.1 nucleotide-diphospho-sugar transferase [Hortaea werneckii]KAI7243452.1 nucleotide-diphospho-sugar transferase [Hortaea werneckii]KAI7330519.1 nucleotide-diphospho-sugar transferase [Hortaea werneckii]KAI7404674.1 nucleotide-diphospho-sugar transferase [Hortaea werneckii]
MTRPLPTPEGDAETNKQQLEQAPGGVLEGLASVGARPTAALHSVSSLQEELDNSTRAKADPASKGFAYAFYATSDSYACSALVNIHCLQHELGSKLPIHMLVSDGVSSPYIQGFEAAGVSVHHEQTPKLKSSMMGSYYEDCLLKLLAFKLHALDPRLKRVLALDSDQLVRQNLDHLFAGLPEVDLAAPRAYWLSRDFLASTFMMISLSDRLWKTLEDALDTISYDKFDMDLINDLLGDTVMMLSGEYVTLNSHWEDWNLPKWYHPTQELNMTTIEIINSLARTNTGIGKRQVESEGIQQPAPDAGQAAELPRPPISGAPPPLAMIPNPTQPEPSAPAMPKLWDAQKPSIAHAALASGTQQPHPVPSFLNDHLHSQPPLPPGAEDIPTPRFPATHPFTQELYNLQDAAAVIHFTAQGKPWARPVELIKAARPDAHPVLAAQFELWREIAERVCPGGVPQG